MAEAGSPPAEIRAGFWRRALAILIDVALVALASASIGAILLGLTDGRVRIGSTLIDITICSPVDPQQFKLPSPPSSFHVTNTDQCAKSFFGIVHDRFVRVSEVTHSGLTTYSRALTYPIDADGRVVSVHYIDYLIYVLLLAYVVLMEWLCGWTIGKEIMRIRVQSLGGGPLGGGPITFVQAVKRSVIRFLPWPLFLLPFVVPVLAGYGMFSIIATTADAGILALVLCIVVVIFMWNFVQATRRRELPWDDRWAKTEVVRQ